MPKMRKRMYNPVESTGDSVGKDPASLVKNGSINAKALGDIIPKGTTNTWEPGPRATAGFKYNWTYGGCYNDR